MALTDPQSVTLNSSAVSLPRVLTDTGVGTFTNYDAKTRMRVNHTYGRRTRRNVRLDLSKITADPLVASTNREVSASVGFWVDLPVSGFSAADLEDLSKGILTWLTASSNANLKKVLAGEN